MSTGEKRESTRTLSWTSEASLNTKRREKKEPRLSRGSSPYFFHILFLGRSPFGFLRVHTSDLIAERILMLASLSHALISFD